MGAKRPTPPPEGSRATDKPTSPPPPPKGRCRVFAKIDDVEVTVEGDAVGVLENLKALLGLLSAGGLGK